MAASWEPRFLLGLKRLLDETGATSVCMYYFEEYQERTLGERKATQGLAEKLGFKLVIEQLSFERPAESWRSLQTTLCAEPTHQGEVLVDITTMPRGMIWSVLFWLEQAGKPIHYAYHCPESYSSDWLARDPNEPRFAFKLAGTSVLNRPTAILAVTGFDIERATQAVEYFEPAQTVLATQVGNQFDNFKRNTERHKGIEIGSHRVDCCEMDSYSEDRGYRAILDATRPLVKKFNVVLLSFGPKLSALSLYQVKRELPETALAYIHCKDYNESYSDGIGKTFSGPLPLGDS